MSESNFIKYSSWECPDCGEKVPHTKLIEVAKERKKKGITIKPRFVPCKGTGKHIPGIAARKYSLTEKGKRAGKILDEMVGKLRDLDQDIKGKEVITQRKIEHKWDAAKLLITRMDAKVLLYILPQYGLYVESITPILVVPEEAPLWHKLYLRGKQMPHIVSVRTQDTSRVVDFIREHKEFQAYRIFKHGLEYKTATKDSLVGIACETAKNMLNLFPGKTFRINSKDIELTNLFYEIVVEINEEHKLGCSFDFDEYDYTLLIKKYKRFKEVRLVDDDGVVFTENVFHRWAVVTILYGESLPNSWSMKAKEIEGGEWLNGKNKLSG